MNVVLESFDKINPKSIQPTIQQVFLNVGLQKNYSTENYAYGFAKEIRRRLASVVSSGDVLDLVNGTSGESSSGQLKEGEWIRV
jgi:hypothetical protein